MHRRRRVSPAAAVAATQLIKLFQSTNVTRIDWLDRAAMEALQEQTKVAAIAHRRCEQSTPS